MNRPPQWTESCQELQEGVPVMVQWLMNPTSIHKDAGLITCLTQWVKNLAWLWLWCRPAATALLPPLAWELPCAAGAALKRQKTKKKKKKICMSPNMDETRMNTAVPPPHFPCGWRSLGSASCSQPCPRRTEQSLFLSIVGTVAGPF